MPKTFPKISTKISMSVFPRLFLFYRVFGCFSAMGVQKHYKKTFCKKNHVEKFLQKIRPKIQNRLILEKKLSRFWAFLDEGSSKTRLKKYRKNKSDPSPFSYFDPPTHHGGHRFFFGLPLAKLSARLCTAAHQLVLPLRPQQRSWIRTRASRRWASPLTTRPVGPAGAASHEISLLFVISAGICGWCWPNGKAEIGFSVLFFLLIFAPSSSHYRLRTHTVSTDVLSSSPLVQPLPQLRLPRIRGLPLVR
jgi:hypothetical protein